MSKQSDNIFRNSIIASGVSAIITKTSVAPLERIKLLKQSQTYYNQTRYTSLFKSCQYILKNDGFKGLYRGNVSNLYRVLPAYLIKFPLINYFVTFFKNMNRKEQANKNCQNYVNIIN